MFQMAGIQKLVEQKIVDRWAYTPMTEHAVVLCEPFAESMALQCRKLLPQAKISGSITGGAAPPSGPVVGAVCAYQAGSIVMPAIDLKSSFTYATFKLERDGLPPYVTSTPTTWMKKFVSILLPMFDEAWTAWFQTWSGTTTAFGGVASWVSSSPPAPGPWTAGSVNRLLLSHGSSTSPLMRLLESNFVSKLRSSSVTVTIGDQPHTISMCANDNCASIARSIAGGMSDAFLKMIESIEIADLTGVAASGVAAPGGSVVGSITCSLDVGG